MLTQITINNYAIIDSLDVDLNAGLTVLTGETGAGKSIIIDAIELALGKRASSNVIKPDQSRADISVSFDVATILDAQSILEKYALNHEKECCIRRSISADGRSKSFINGIPVTLNILQELSDSLINIHGQHEFHSLLKPDKQRELLDQFGGLTDTVTAVKNHFQQWKNTETELTSLKNQLKNATERTDFLKFQIQELDDLNLKENEFATLEQEHKLLANADAILSNAQQTLLTLSEDESQNTLILLNKASNALHFIKKHTPSLNTAAELINTAIIHTEEAASEIKSYLDHLDLNPERLQFLEKRLSDIYQCAKKHRLQPNELITRHLQLKDEFNQIEHRDEHIERLEKTATTLKNAYFTLAKQLSEKRIAISKKIDRLITENMQHLNMKGGKFSIHIEASEPSATGLEEINFLVSANPGQPLQPLNKVASGGELSRISLAIQVIIAQNSNTPTLIFDEVDVGIGGGTAEIIGNLLKQLGTKTQVFCITHLGQVASKGNHHLRIEKLIKNKTTRVALNYLTLEDRIEEIARLIGGINITPQTIAHAKEMLCHQTWL